MMKKSIIKKTIAAVLMVASVTMLCACGSDGNKNRTANKNKTVNDILNEQNQKASKDNKDSKPADETATEDNAAVESSAKSPDEIVPAANVPPTEEPVEYDKIDIDLTTMSSTMVYTEVYNMQADPDEYVGKIVKMKGSSGYSLDEKTNIYYFACVIQDATACCSNGIEYELNKNYKIPFDYPEMEHEITVVGRFETYIEGDYKYITLKNANLLADEG